MPRRSEASPEAPDYIILYPNTRECTNPKGGIVRLFDGVPVVVGTKPARLGLDDNTAHTVDAIKLYLERILADKAGDAERAREAIKLLEDIRNSCWWWYTQSESWGKDFGADIKEGRKEMAKIYGFFSF